jgi:ABC-2 type transport system permease protein
MTLALAYAEWRRFVLQKLNLWVLAVFALLLGTSAVWSGLAAREYRAAALMQQDGWEHTRLKAQAAAAQPRDGTQAMMAAFLFARADAPPAQLPALGGLALGTGTFHLLSPDARVTVESRHTDARKAERLGNPLLEDFGLPDFSTVLALLLPLAILGLTCGLVQEEREQGQWRLVVAQCARPGRVFAWALGLRGAAVWWVAAAASSAAFALDPGATGIAWLSWLVTVAAFCAIWLALAGLLCLLPLSAGSAALGLLACWLLLTFVVPAALATWVNRDSPMPSRLAAIAAVRNAQQEAEVHMDEHLADWYAANPEAAPAQRSSHTWPVSFLPRYLQQDLDIRPLMEDFDHARAQRFVELERWAWLSPNLALAMVADRLAGIDAPRYLRHVQRVNAYEDAWRDFFVPRVMSYRGLTADDFDHLPRFTAPEEDFEAAVIWQVLAWGLLALALAGGVAAARGSLQRP